MKVKKSIGWFLLISVFALITLQSAVATKPSMPSDNLFFSVNVSGETPVYNEDSAYWLNGYEVSYKDETYEVYNVTTRKWRRGTKIASIDFDGVFIEGKDRKVFIPSPFDSKISSGTQTDVFWGKARLYNDEGELWAEKAFCTFTEGIIRDEVVCIFSNGKEGERTSYKAVFRKIERRNKNILILKEIEDITAANSYVEQEGEIEGFGQIQAEHFQIHDNDNREIWLEGRGAIEEGIRVRGRPTEGIYQYGCMGDEESLGCYLIRKTDLPELDVRGDTVVNESETMMFGAVARINDERVPITISNLPEGAEIIQGPIVTRFVWETDYDDAGNYTLDVVIDTGFYMYRDTINISVLDVNRPPAVDLDYPEGVLQGTVTLSWTAEDPDGDDMAVDAYVSFDEGQTWDVLARNIEHVGSTDVDTTRIDNGIYMLRLNATDEHGASTTATSGLIEIYNPADEEAPVVTLISPENGAVLDVSNFTIEYLVVDDFSTELNCSLYAMSEDIGLEWQRIGSQIAQNNTIMSGYVKNVPDGTYIWNILCEDEAGNLAFAPENFTGTVDTTQPVLPQCSDGEDNDNDGLIDFPDDSGCEDANDDNETDEVVCVNNLEISGVSVGVDIPEGATVAMFTDTILMQGSIPFDYNLTNLGLAQITNINLSMSMTSNMTGETTSSSQVGGTIEPQTSVIYGEDFNELIDPLVDGDYYMSLSVEGIDEDGCAQNDMFNFTLRLTTFVANPECSDGIDNDGDGLIDFPNDPGCADGQDDNETDEVIPPVYECSDGIDNDGDGLIDLEDPGCEDENDDNETDEIVPPVYECSDGIDNDGDGLIDFPNDLGCTDANDDNETDEAAEGMYVTLTADSVFGIEPMNINFTCSVYNGEAPYGYAYNIYDLEQGMMHVHMHMPDSSPVYEFNHTLEAGNWTAVCAVTDANGTAAESNNVTIIVLDESYQNNTAPVIGELGSFMVYENSTLMFEVTASDAENDTLYYSAENLPEGAVFNASSHVFAWTPSFEQAGEYNVTFVVSDVLHTRTENATITVLDLNRAPVMDPVGDIFTNETEPISIFVNAVDEDNDTLAYSAENLPEGAEFNATAQMFEWTPLDNQSGFYVVIFSVTDGIATDAQASLITVYDINTTAGDENNTAPVMESIDDVVVNENETVTIFVNATDADNDTLTYDALNMPEGSVFDAQTFTWTPGFNQSGDYAVIFTVTDGNATDAQAVLITVDDAGDGDADDGDEDGDDDEDDDEDNDDQGDDGGSSDNDDDDSGGHSTGSGIWWIDGNIPEDDADDGHDSGMLYDDEDVQGGQEDDGNEMEGLLTITGDAVADEEEEEDKSLVASTILWMLFGILLLLAIAYLGYRVLKHSSLRPVEDMSADEMF